MCVQLYNEGCHDLYQRGAASQANLPIFEDEVEGYQVRERGRQRYQSATNAHLALLIN